MTYVMSDIHGCFDAYQKMLKKIKFTDRDMLYVLGDVVDWGAEPMQVLRDMSMRANVIPIMGNHDCAALTILKKWTEEIADDNGQARAGTAAASDLSAWFADGGRTTLDGFQALPAQEREYMLEFLLEFALYETVTAAGKRFILTHSGLPKGAHPGNLEDYDVYDFITATVDYKKEYFADTFLVTGHTPTFLIHEDYKGKVYRANNHIAIDAGAAFGGRLACVCLETDEEFYV